jgi:hypothetical protein
MKQLILTVAMFSALSCIKIAANPEVRRPVKHFIHYYRQPDAAQMGLVPRTVYSWLLARKG